MKKTTKTYRIDKHYYDRNTHTFITVRSCTPEKLIDYMVRLMKGDGAINIKSYGLHEPEAICITSDKDYFFYAHAEWDEIPLKKDISNLVIQDWDFHEESDLLSVSYYWIDDDPEPALMRSVFIPLDILEEFIIDEGFNQMVDSNDDDVWLPAKELIDDIQATCDIERLKEIVFCWLKNN